MTNCSICKRLLKDPESVKRGIGPICYGRIRAEMEEQKNEQQEQFLPFKGDIICKRTNSGPQVNIPHRIVKHSPDGFEWGYGGSGPADLALSILAAYIGREAAEKDGLYQEFKWEFIAPMPHSGGVIKKEDVVMWLTAKGISLPGKEMVV
jgi:hypothetical protein